MVFDVEEGHFRLSAKNVKKKVLYFRAINLMEEVLYFKDQIKTENQEARGNIFNEFIRFKRCYPVQKNRMKSEYPQMLV